MRDQEILLEFIDKEEDEDKKIYCPIICNKKKNKRI